jgi:hypothetical protein
MYGKEQAKEKIIDFLKSDEKAMLLTGTHQFKKHKLVMAILNKYYKNAKILFRVNGMDNLTNEDFVGFAGLKKTPKCGERVKIGNNYYIFDSINRSTWSRSTQGFDFAILYPIDSAIRSNITDILDDFTEHKNIQKLFLVSWTDRKDYNYTELSRYYERHVIFDAAEENIAYHKRVLDVIEKS